MWSTKSLPPSSLQGYRSNRRVWDVGVGGEWRRFRGSREERHDPSVTKQDEGTSGEGV